MAIEFLLDGLDRCLAFFVCRHVVRARVKRETLEAVLDIAKQGIDGNQVDNDIALKNHAQRILPIGREYLYIGAAHPKATTLKITRGSRVVHLDESPKKLLSWIFISH